MECQICYENVNDNGDMIRLECLHSLCKRCLGKLEKRICPYCRADIAVEITTILYRPVLTKEYKVYMDPIRIRGRRRRRRRPKSERLENSDSSRPIIAENLENRSLTKAFRTGCSDRKRQKYRQARSGKWTGMNRRNFCRSSNR